MKILQVITTIDPAAGGPVEGMIQQGLEMMRQGHTAHVVTLDPPTTKLDPRLEPRTIFFLGPAFLTYCFSAKLEPWLIEHGPKYDVVVVHGMWQHHGLCVRNASRIAGFKYVMFLHGMLDPWFKQHYPAKHLKKWLYWPWAEYRVLRDANRVLFTTSEELLLARQSFWLYKAREKMVGYGIRRREIPPGEARETFLAQFPDLRGKRNLLYLSRIHPKKGCDLLIQAFAQVAHLDPELHLVMAGPDSAGWVDQLKTIAEARGIASRVTFTGMLTGPLKWGAYDAADVFVLPSHQENFGIVVAEALASGLPVLTTPKVNIWREIKEAGAGIIHPDTQEGTEKLLGDWIAASDAERARMSANAMLCFSRHFDIVQVTDNLLGELELVTTEERIPHTYNGTRF